MIDSRRLGFEFATLNFNSNGTIIIQIYVLGGNERGQLHFIGDDFHGFVSFGPAFMMFVG